MMARNMSNRRTTSETSRMPQQSHFQSLQRAVMGGDLERGRDPRRRIPGLPSTSTLTWDEMAQAGRDDSRQRLKRRRNN